jgi:hypothetical protein
LQQDQLRQLCRDFDFTEFSKRVLADKWALFTTTQRIEFVEVFTLSGGLLPGATPRVLPQRKVILHGQDLIAGRLGEVYRDLEEPRISRGDPYACREEGWKAYDVHGRHQCRADLPAQLQEIIPGPRPRSSTHRQA